MLFSSHAKLVALTALSVALVGCGAKVAAGSSGAPSSLAASKSKELEANAVATPYAAIAAGKVDIEGGLVDVAARAPGIIRDVLVQEGDHVAKDQVLARQEDEDARLSRDQAAAALAQAQSQLPILGVQLAAAQREESRLQRLAAGSAASQQSFDQAADARRQLEAQIDAQKTSVALARAQLAAANYSVELHVVRAPADGVIVRTYASPGTGASTLQVTPLFQLQPATQRIIRAEVEERSLTQVKVGQNVEIVPESQQTMAYEGRVVRIAAVMGARKLKSDDPSEKQDERVVEVVVDAEKAPVLVGQRVLVKFLKDAAHSPARATG